MSAIMTMNSNRWPLRSFLFVPAHRRSWIEKAARVEPDAVMLDLEDSVPPDQQEAARAHLASEIEELCSHGIAPFVRIHAFGVDTAAELEAAVRKGLAGVMLPKASNAAEIRGLHDLLSYYEGREKMAHGEVAILPLPETAEGLQNAESLARASTRVRGIAGTVSGPTSADVARAFGFRATMGGVEQYYMNSKLVLDSRAGGAAYPVAGVFGVPLDDLAAIRELLVRARNFGYTGSTVLHPSHVAIANEVYSPTAEEAEYYQGLLDAMAEAEAQGAGAVRYRGAMIDYAMLPFAREIVDTYKRYQGKAN